MGGWGKEGWTPMMRKKKSKNKIFVGIRRKVGSAWNQDTWVSDNETNISYPLTLFHHKQEVSFFF